MRVQWNINGTRRHGGVVVLYPGDTLKLGLDVEWQPTGKPCRCQNCRSVDQTLGVE